MQHYLWPGACELDPSYCSYHWYYSALFMTVARDWPGALLFPGYATDDMEHTIAS
jgi:hypothetical protein